MAGFEADLSGVPHGDRAERRAGRLERPVGVVALVAGGAYDEVALKAGLDALEPTQRVLFAAACAERLFGLYRLFAERTGQGAEAELRDALDLAWRVQSGDVPRSEVDGRRAGAEALVPHDDDADWSVWSPFAQNGAASVAYALRAWLSGDSQDAVRAARQVYEAADYLVQLDDPGDTYSENGELVNVVVSWIADALSDGASAGVEMLRAAAAAGGQTLMDAAKGTPEA